MRSRDGAVHVRGVVVAHTARFSVVDPLQSSAAPSASSRSRRTVMPSGSAALASRSRTTAVLPDDERLLLVRLEAGRAQPVRQVGRPVVPVVLPLELAAARTEPRDRCRDRRVGVRLVEVAPEHAATPGRVRAGGRDPQHGGGVVDPLELEAGRLLAGATDLGVEGREQLGVSGGWHVPDPRCRRTPGRPLSPPAVDHVWQVSEYFARRRCLAKYPYACHTWSTAVAVRGGGRARADEPRCAWRQRLRRPR